MKKFIIIILILVVIVVAVIFSAKNMIAKAAITGGVKGTTGLEAKVKSTNIGVLNTLIGIYDFKLLNPPGFSDETMVDIPEIYVDYDLGALLKKKVHLEEVRINLKEFVVERNEKGELNLNSLKTARPKEEEEPPPEEKVKRKTPEFQIDKLYLKISKVIFADYSRGETPVVKEFDIKVDRTFENITNPRSLVTLIVFESLKNTTIARLANFDLEPLKQEVSQTLATATEQAQQKLEQAREKAKQRIMERRKEAEQTLREQQEKLTGSMNKMLPQEEK